MLPVLLRYPPCGSVSPAWTFGSALLTAVRLCSQLYNRAEVLVLPLIYPTETDRQDPEAFAERVRAQVAAALGIPAVDEWQEDYFAMEKAGIRVSWDESRLIIPSGVLDADGMFPYQPARRTPSHNGPKL